MQRSFWQCKCRCIAQGCSEYNITVLIDQRDSVRALRAVHGRFYLAKLTIGLGVIGPGLVGRTLINQLYQQRQVQPVTLFLARLVSKCALWKQAFWFMGAPSPSLPFPHWEDARPSLDADTEQAAS